MSDAALVGMDQDRRRLDGDRLSQWTATARQGVSVRQTIDQALRLSDRRPKDLRRGALRSLRGPARSEPGLLPAPHPRGSARTEGEAMSEREEFSVWVFWPDESSFRLAHFVHRGLAARVAKLATNSAGPTSDAARVIITDGGDHTVFEWRRGEGVTWPTPEARERKGGL